MFAERGFGATAIEEIAARADVSKPVVYEHFGGKGSLHLRRRARGEQLVTVSGRADRQLIAPAARAGGDRDLDYVEHHPHGFRILVRDSPLGSPIDAQQSIVGDIATRLEVPLSAPSRAKGSTPRRTLYAQMVAGASPQTGQWWLDAGGGPPYGRHRWSTCCRPGQPQNDPLLATELPPSPRSPDA